MPDPSHEPAPPMPPPRQPGRRRWRSWQWLLLIGLCLLAGLLVAGIVTVEVVLRGDQPRLLVINELQGMTRMRVELDGLAARWNGHTTLRGLRLYLPLESQPLLTADRLEVWHQPLLGVLWSREPTIRRVEAVGMDVRAQPDARGQWNLARAADLMAGDNSDAGGGATAPLPGVQVRQATLTVLDAAGQTQLRSPLTLTLSSGGATAQELSLQLPGIARADARFSPVSGQHELKLHVPGLAALLRAVEPRQDWPPTTLSLQWQGQWSGDTLEGLAREVRLESSPWQAQGSVALRFSSQGLSLRPRQLVLTDTRQSQWPLTLTGGEARWQGDAVTLDALAVQAVSHVAQVTGQWSLQQGYGQFTAAYQGQWPPSLRHSGVAVVKLHQPSLGPVRLDVDLTTQGRYADQRWRGRLNLDTAGEAWTQAMTAVRVERLTVQKDRGVLRLDGLAAVVEQDGDMIHLRRLDLPEAPDAHGTGWYRLSDGAWALAGRVDDWKPHGAPAAMDLKLNANGQADRVEAMTLSAAGGGWRVAAQGSHLPQRDTPLMFDAQARFTPPGEPDPRFTMDAMEGSANVTGSLSPLSLTLRSNVDVQAPRWGERTLPDVRSQWQGTVTPREVTLRSEPIDWLTAKWEAQGRYDLAAGQAAVSAQVSEMEIGSALDLAGAPVQGLVAGQFDAKVEATLGDQWELPQRVEGQWTVRNLRAGRVTGERGQGQFMLDGRSLVLREMELTRGQGRFRGQTRTQLTRDLETHVVGGLEAFTLAWPEQDLAVTIDGKTDLVVRLREGTSRGEVDGRVAIDWQQQRIADVQVEGQMQGHDLILEQVGGDVLGGRIEGEARLALNKPLTSSANLSWREVSGDALQRVLKLPPTMGLAGTLQGKLTLAVSQQPRALEPLQGHLVLEPGLSLRGSTLGRIDLTAFIGEQRVVLDRGDVELLGGRAEVWLQWTRRHGEQSLQTQVKANGLDLAQVAALGGPVQTPLVGRMSIDGMAAGVLGRGATWFGRATLGVDQSDLIGLAPVAALYNTMNLGQTGPEPTGRGNATLTLGGGTLGLADIDYFNRGTEIIGEVAVRNIWDENGREVSGIAAGAARPFRDLGVPGAKTLDQLFRALQGNTAAVRIDGHLRDGLAGLRTRSVPLEDLSNWFSQVLLQQGRGSTP